MTPRRTSRSVLLALVASLALAAFGAGVAGAGSGGASPKVFSDGDAIAVKVGQRFVVSLESNPTTGYAWTAVTNANVTFVRSRYVKPTSSRPGATGTQRLTFRATKAGQGSLVLQYARSFEANQAPAKTATFALTVNGRPATGGDMTVYGVGKSISARVGDEFVIALESNPTTGYAWVAAANPAVEFVSTEYVAPSSKLMGAAGTQRLTFRATAAGSGTLVLNYVRSFEPANAPAQTQSFPLTVAAK